MLGAKPDLIVDAGSLGPTYASLADRAQAQTGIPTILLDGSFARMPETGAARAQRHGRIPATLLSVLALLALAVGKYPVSPAHRAGLLGHRLLGLPARVPAAAETVVMQVRLPRVVAALVVGAALSAAGATYQGLFRNPPAATVTPALLRLIYGIDVVVAPVPGIAAPVRAPVIG